MYCLLGKAAAAGRLFGATPAVAMRSFQVFLYVVLVAWCLARARTFSPALGFLLLTPQLWYVFSYINGDALPFLLLTGLIFELGWPESGIRAFWRSREAGPTAGVFATVALTRRSVHPLAIAPGIAVALLMAAAGLAWTPV